jgi:hypothetical protein
VGDPPSYRWRTLVEVISLFVGMGCEPQEFPGEDVLPHADWQVHYLFNPVNGAIAVLPDIGSDDEVAPSVLAALERTLGVEVPWGPPH